MTSDIDNNKNDYCEKDMSDTFTGFFIIMVCLGILTMTNIWTEIFEAAVTNDSEPICFDTGVINNEDSSCW